MSLSGLLADKAKKREASNREQRASLFPVEKLAAVTSAAISPRVTHLRSIIDMAAIAEAAAVMQTVAGDDLMGVIHEANGLTPAPLIEIACGARVMARVRDVTPMCETADAPGTIAMGNEVGNQRLEAAGEAFCDRNRASRSRNGYHSA